MSRLVLVCCLVSGVWGCLGEDGDDAGGDVGEVGRGCACHLFVEDDDERFHSVRIACGDVRCVEAAAIRCLSEGRASWVGECDEVPTGAPVDERFTLYEDDDEDADGHACIGNGEDCYGQSEWSCDSVPGCQWLGEDYGGCLGPGVSCRTQSPESCEQWGCTRVWAHDELACAPRTATVSGLGTVWEGVITEASPDTHTSQCGQGGGREAVTIWWEPPAPGRYALDVWEGDVDAVLTVYAGCGEILGCVDDDFFELESDGRALLLVIEGYDDEEVGPLHLEVRAGE